MSAMNPKCHEKGCKCAICTYTCSRCYVNGRCPDSICQSEKGMQNCNKYKEHKLYENIKP